MDSIADQLAQYGVPLIGLNVLLQQLGLPIPAVPTMMLAGALAVAGRIDFAAAFAISVMASLVADLIWFWAGRRYGYPVLRFLYQDGSDSGRTSDAPSQRRNRPQVFCPAGKRQTPARVDDAARRPTNTESWHRPARGPVV